MPETTSRFPRLLAELVVVFLGVYAAFFLDGCREERERDARRDQILQMLAEDFQQAAGAMEMAAASFGAQFDPFLDGYEKGERPPLLPIPIPVHDPIDTWGAVLGAGGLDTLEVQTIRDVEAVLALVSPMTEVAREFNHYVRQVLIPNLGKEESEYYDEDGKLRSKYQWYFHSLRTVKTYLETLADQTSDLADQLR